MTRDQHQLLPRLVRLTALECFNWFPRRRCAHAYECVKKEEEDLSHVCLIRPARVHHLLFRGSCEICIGLVPTKRIFCMFFKRYGIFEG